MRISNFRRYNVRDVIVDNVVDCIKPHIATAHWIPVTQHLRANCPIYNMCDLLLDDLLFNNHYLREV